MEEPQGVSDRMLHDASPAAAIAPAPAEDDVREAEIGGDIAVAAAGEEPPAAAPSGSEAAGDGVIAVEHEHAAANPVSDTKMEVDEGEGGVVDAEQTAAPSPGEVKAEVNGGSTLDKGEYVVALACVPKEEKMEVCENGVPEQLHTVAAVASEVKIEGCEGGLVVDQQSSTPAGGGCQMKKEGECLVGRYISRSVTGHGRILLGKVASYDSSTGVYSVVFEDGQGEDFELAQLQLLLVGEENGAFGMKVSCRKRKLDLLVSSGGATEVKGPPCTRQRVNESEVSTKPDESQQSGSGSDASEDVESSSNSSNHAKELPEEHCPPVQILELPPSSGDIAVPEEAISYLFSVYNFLRSFSVQLFLSPFGLDDFVSSINCTTQNTLLDAVHVSLLRALRRHLETKSSEGSKLASNCLKYLDWALLDSLTWPAFLLEYLYLMGVIKDLGGRRFGRSVLAIEYYKLPVTLKLRILQLLCDHVTDSEELKTELEDREGYSEEMEYEMDSSTSAEVGPRSISTRGSKASAYKKLNALENLENDQNGNNPEAAPAHASQDDNSDDCRICGMDGTLVCCDGCPWAYHSRCIGQNKAFLPQGDWFCPECVVNKLGPTSSRIERGARGAQFFGIDMCGRSFLGCCNYLLVVGTSPDAEFCARYYNHLDVAKVLQILASSDAHIDICRRMTEYWSHLLDIFQNERSKIGKEVCGSLTPQSNILLTVTPVKANNGSVQATLKDGGDSKSAVLSQTNVCLENQFTTCSANSSEAFTQTPLAQNYVDNTYRNGAFGPSGTSSISHQSASMATAMPNITQAQPAHGLIRPDLCGSVIGNGTSRENIKSSSARKDLICPSYQSKPPVQLVTENMSSGKTAKFSSFRPQAYMNLYIHGNVAASAAANLAVLKSDEGKAPTSHLTTNQRKKLAADCALQMKAFSSAALQFVWPSTEKKVMEVPRDRCGWCLACQSSAGGTKKACFLNMATANASKGSARILSGMRIIKNCESHFPSILTYLTHMEESLRGLLVGPLQDLQRREQWYNQLKGASNCRNLIPLLLELESNIRGVTFSASWLKLIDDWPMESPSASVGASRPAAYQKRGTGGRRGRKRSMASESGPVTDDDNSWKEVNWWSGGNVSKRILQRGAIPILTLRKAARQGGKKRMPGLSYHEGSNCPRRTRQFAWRACVGLCQNSSQLALQVRYLDAHIRWKEFIPPDQVPSDGKSLDSDFSVLRNAVICDKKIVDNKIRYALKFPNQKHLPVRVTKNILEAEDNQDGDGKFWFSENHIPLYLLRDFEQKAGASSLSTPGMLDSNYFANFYRRRVKAFVGDVFFYLLHKDDVYPCTSCKKDVAFRSVGSKEGNAAPSLTCKLCLQKRNLMLTNYNTNASFILPQQKSNVHQAVAAPKIIFKVGSSHSAEPVAKVEAHPIAKVEAQPVVKKETCPIVKMETQPAANVEAHPTAKVEAQPIVNSATQNIAGAQAQPKAKSKKPKPEKPRKPKKVQDIKYFGLVWKKNTVDKNSNDNGDEFRAKDVILKGKDGIGSPIKPTCCLCSKAYCPDFLYVRCERCQKWFHGDALQLKEEQIFQVVQYRCCRCRRRAIPKCPHSDDYKKPEPEFSEQTITTSSQSTMLSSEENFAVADQDPLLASYGRVEPGEQTMDADLSMDMVNFNTGINQKLSVRRGHNKNCEYVDQASIPMDEYYIQNQSQGNANINFSHSNEFSLSEADGVDPSDLLGWDFSQGNACAAPSDFAANCPWNETSCGSVADEYEPQTYFSFTELLEADDTQFDNTFGMSSSLQDDGTGSLDQQGIGFDEMSFMLEDGASNMHFPAIDSASDEDVTSARILSHHLISNAQYVDCRFIVIAHLGRKVKNQQMVPVGVVVLVGSGDDELQTFYLRYAHMQSAAV
uniref:PHD-type domain-containing protein n=1 Tax=Leersia perrieri TaxID=77586 RepID=A0A0D9XP30_9ORYZ